jgi:hypothetical protein
MPAEQKQALQNKGSLVYAAHLALLSVVAAILTYPCLRQGLPDGHDTRPHLAYQHFFDEQIAAGDLYPRWMPGLNRGLGGGIFFMQYPLPYYVSWFVGRIAPNHFGLYTETRSEGVGLALATILAAVFTYAWCLRFSDEWSALAAAIVYITLPYFLSIDLYMRVAVGEFWAISLIPLTLFAVENLPNSPRRSMAALALGLALVVMSHLFTAMLLAPVLLIYAVWRAKSPRRAMVVIETISASALALGLAGVYVLPAIVHSRFMHPLNFIPAYGGNFSPLSQLFPLDASLFPQASRGIRMLGSAARILGAVAASFVAVRWYSSRKEKPSHLRLVLALLSVAVLLLTISAGHLHFGRGISGTLPLTGELIERRGEIFLSSFLMLVFALLSYWSLEKTPDRGPSDLLILLALGSYLMMTGWSRPVWEAFRFLWTVQFSWRFSALLLFPVAGLAALAVARLRRESLARRVLGGLVAVAVWCVVAVGPAKVGDVGRAFRGPGFITYQPQLDVALPIYTQAEDPREPLRVRPPDDQKIHVDIVRGSGRASVLSAGPRQMELEASCESDCTLIVGQFYYPAWRAKLLPGPGEVSLKPGSPGGLMQVSLPPGTHHLELLLPRGWSERLGLWLSAFSFAFVVFLAMTGKHTPGQTSLPADSCLLE